MALMAMLFACLFTLPATASDPSAARWTNLAATVFHNYDRDRGLPHPVPTALAQDRDGFIWIGTQGGLSRWDGYRFHTYKADPAVAGSLPDDWVQTLHVDKAGRLWIGGGAGGLSHYDAVRDRFVSVSLGSDNGRTHIAAIEDDGRSGLWAGSDRGLHHIPAHGPVRIVATPMPDAPVRALLRDRTGTLWVGTTKGLARRKAGTTAWTMVPLASDTIPISALFEDSDGRIWIGTTRRGLFMVDRPDALPRPAGSDPALSTSSVSTISAAGPREIWVGLRSNGIVALNATTGSFRRIRHDRTVSSSLVHNDIWALLRDNAGSLWVASTGGLSYHPRSSGLIKTMLASPNQPGGLSASDPLAVLATRNGRVWTGYLDGGVDVIDPTVGRIAALRPGDGRTSQTLPPDVVFAMAEADDGSVYIGTRRGLYRADPAAKAVRLIPLPDRDPQAAITALSFDDGVLWVGSDDAGGLLGFIPRADGGVGRVLFGAKDSVMMTDGGINTILRGKGHDLWIGARNGLYRLNLATHIVEHIAAAPADRAALPGRFVVAMLIDQRGRLWVGTFGGGLAMMTGRDTEGRARFRRIGVAQGLPHMNVDSLQMDGAGTIWAGTDDGLARVDPTTFSVRPVRQADGSSLIDYYAGAGASSANGEALFGAKGGITIVRPGPLPRWTFRPPLRVTDLRIGGVPQPVALANHATSTPLTLTPDTNSLAVEFAALDYTAPERNRYSYRLDGFDRDWTETDANRRLAIYTNLPPGDYVLRLRGSNRSGIWVEKELALPIRVLPAWYQRLWFRLACGLVLLLAVAALVRWRTRYLRRRQGDLENQIAGRTADLRAANRRLAHLAQTDTLTGCSNRRHFMTVANEWLVAVRRDGMPLCLAILDLDEFKAVNDRHGHPGGDAVLEMAGVVILDHLRPIDVAGRIGGEEFALLLPDLAIDDAREFADRLREALSMARIKVDGVSIGVTASLGVAELGPDEDMGRLYARADASLYVAKEAGRNRVEMSSPAE